MSTKPRSDAVLLNLPEVDKSKLREALLAGMSYVDACVFTQKEIGVQTNTHSMRQFWSQECVHIRILRRAEAAEEADQLESAAAELPGRFTEAAKHAIQERFYNLSTNPAAKPGELMAVNEIIMRDRESQIKEREVSLKERAVAVQERRLAIEQRAADFKAEDCAAAQAIKLEAAEIENQKKKFEDAVDARRREYFRAVAVWNKAQTAGENPGPSPEWDLAREIGRAKEALEREKEGLASIKRAKEG